MNCVPYFLDKKDQSKHISIKIALILILAIFLAACGGGSSVGGGSSSKVKLSPEGTDFSKKGFSLEIPEGTVNIETFLELSIVEEEDVLPEDIAYYSPVYVLAGAIDNIQGPITLTWDIPEDVVANTDLSREELEDSFFVTLMEEYSPETGAGEAFPGYNLPFEVDLDEMLIKATLDLGEAQAFIIPQLKMSAPALARNKQSSGPSSIAARMGRTWTWSRTLDSQEGHFQAVFSSGLDLNAIDSILSSLEEYKVIIEELGLSFDARSSYPITVEIKDIGSSDGNFSGSNNPNSREMQIHRKFFIPGQFESNRGLVQATAGHELLHMVQSFYYPQDRSYAANFEEFLWLDEASATWFKSVVLGNPTWSPNVAVDNLNFVQTPLNFPTSPASHGYGASWYLRYLTGPAGLGNELISEIYKLAHQSGGSNYPGIALADSLDPNETSSSEQWPAFLGTYLLQPGVLGSDLTTIQLLDHLMLSVVEDEGTENGVLTFEPAPKNEKEIGSYKPIINSMPIDQEGSHPQIILSASLEPLSAKALVVNINRNEITRETLEKFKGWTLTINALSEGVWSGVSVYGIPVNSGMEAAVPLAAIGADQPPLGMEATGLEIKGFGPTDTYDRVFLIFYNSDPTVAEPSSEDLRVTLKYQPPNQCLQFSGNLKVEDSLFDQAPCDIYDHCPDPSMNGPSHDAMGDSDDAYSAGGDCSEAPPYCFEKAVITDLLSFIQPGISIPFGFSVEEFDGEVGKLGMTFNYQNNENAELLFIHLSNDAQADLFNSRWNFGPEGDLSLDIPYGSGAISLSGTLGEDDGVGSFVFTHPALGDFTSGAWNATCTE